MYVCTNILLLKPCQDHECLANFNLNGFCFLKQTKFNCCFCSSYIFLPSSVSEIIKLDKKNYQLFSIKVNSLIILIDNSINLPVDLLGLKVTQAIMHFIIFLSNLKTGFKFISWQTQMSKFWRRSSSQK